MLPKDIQNEISQYFYCSKCNRFSGTLNKLCKICLSDKIYLEKASVGELIEILQMFDKNMPIVIKDAFELVPIQFVRVKNVELTNGTTEKCMVLYLDDPNLF